MVLIEKISMRIAVLRDDIRRKNKEIEAAFKDKSVPKEMTDKLISERNDMFEEEDSRTASFEALRAVGQ